jgi:hypothetical protein
VKTLCLNKDDLLLASSLVVLLVICSCCSDGCLNVLMSSLFSAGL